MADSNLEHRINEIEKRLAKIEELIFVKAGSAKSRSDDSFEEMLIEKIDDLGTQDLVVISLKMHQKQTKEEVKKTLIDWGKAFGNWFEGGNFSGRLIKKKGLVKVEGKDKAGEELYSLSKKGESHAGKLIEELKTVAGK